MKWSLRTVLVVIAIIGVALAWRTNSRNRLIKAADQIQSMGAEVTYQSQHPFVFSEFSLVSPAYARKPRKVTRTLADGSQVTESRTSTWESTLRIGVETSKINHGSLPPNPSRLASWFSNEDVIVDAVQVNEADVNEEFVKILCELRGLKIVGILRSKRYFRVVASNPVWYEIEQEHRRELLEELGKPFEEAKSLIRAKLPDVEIFDGMAK